MNISKSRALGLFASLAISVTSTGAQAQEQVASSESAHGGSLSASIKTLSGQMIASATEAQRSDSPFLLDAGDEISICVSAPNAGFVSVWSRTPVDSHLDRLYPNDFTHEENTRAAAIDTDEKVCIGSATDPYRIRVTNDQGESEIYVMWTRSVDDQLAPDDVVIIDDRTGARNRPRAFAATTMTYNVE